MMASSDACLSERVALLFELLAAAARRVSVAAQRLEFVAARVRGGGELRPGVSCAVLENQIGR
jgi:hypothetical protein